MPNFSMPWQPYMGRTRSPHVPCGYGSLANPPACRTTEYARSKVHHHIPGAVRWARNVFAPFQASTALRRFSQEQPGQKFRFLWQAAPSWL